MPTQTIVFEKDPAYRRFFTSHVMYNFNNGIAAVDLFEETNPGVHKFVINEDGTYETINHDTVNLVHGTMLITLEQLPGIIKALQDLYDDNMAVINGGDNVEQSTKE